MSKFFVPNDVSYDQGDVIAKIPIRLSTNEVLQIANTVDHLIQIMIIRGRGKIG